jgi:hypothetical protein
MNKLDLVDMTIRPGPGKELKITNETVRLILDLPSAVGGKHFMDWYGEVDAAGRLRKDLKISKDEFDIATLQEKIVKGRDDELTIMCFFLILLNRLLFPTSSWSISNNKVLMIEDMDQLRDIDWCQLVFNDLYEDAPKWHKKHLSCHRYNLWVFHSYYVKSFIYFILIHLLCHYQSFSYKIYVAIVYVFVIFRSII